MKAGLPQFESQSRYRFLEPLLIFFVETLIRWRLLILPGVLLVTAIVWPIADRLEFDQSIDSLYSDNDPHLEAWTTSGQLFGGEEFAIVAWQEKGLFSADGQSLSKSSLARIESIAAQIKEVPGVIPESIQHPGRMLSIPFARQRVLKMIQGVLVGSDQETTAVVVRLKPEGESPVSRGQTIADIRKIAAAHTPPAYVVGEPVQVHDMFRYVEEDGRILFRFSLVMLAIVLFAMFRSVRWVVLPLLLVVLTIRLTEVLLVLAGARLSMVSSMMNSLVTIVGVATATHLAIGFRDRASFLPRREALQRTLTELLPAIFWACATTAVGFTALLTSSITPVRSFGLMMAVATGLAFLVVCFIAPAGMANRERPVRLERSSQTTVRRTLRDLLIGDPVPAPAELYLESGLRGVSRVAVWKPGLASVSVILIFLFCAAGLTRLKIETDFSRNFRNESDLIQSLNFVESRLGGAGNWEVNFAAPEKLTDEFVDSVRTFSRRLREELLVAADVTTDREAAAGHLTKVVSLTDGLDLVPDSRPSLRPPFFRKATAEEKLSALRLLQPEIVKGLYNPEGKRMRLVLRAFERQRSEPKRALMQRVEEIAREVFETPRGSAQPPPQTTGLFVLLTFLIESLLRDQIVSFIVAGLSIGLMMSIAFRSWRIGLISLVPNLFPIVCLVGSMGWLGVPVNIATAMIASVSMGLTVDNSVHYLSAYRRARRQGLGVAGAIERTQTQVGRALVFANAALVCGFSVLTLSHFIPLIYFGVLVSVAMLGGLAGNLFLLPLMLSRIDRSDETPGIDSEPENGPAASPDTSIPRDDSQ